VDHLDLLVARLVARLAAAVVTPRWRLCFGLAVPGAAHRPKKIRMETVLASRSSALLAAFFLLCEPALVGLIRRPGRKLEPASTRVV
jgi:hypothetical protein